VSTGATELVAELVEWLAGLEGLVAVDLDGAANAEPPFVVVGPPRIVYDGQDASPTGYSVTIGLVVDHGESEMARLTDLVPVVVARLDEASAVALRTATPGELPQGARDLPAYFIEIEVAPE
jgi:hypothetical protein